MAIHPRYADAILSGRKKVEFRKRPLAPDIKTVIVYATAPTKMIVGEFDVADILVASPAQLWTSLGAVGSIATTDYWAYYSASSIAVGIIIAGPRRYERARTLADLEPQPAVPQSFAYLPDGVLQQLRGRDALRTSGLARLLEAVRLPGIRRRPPTTVMSLRLDDQEAESCDDADRQVAMH